LESRSEEALMIRDKLKKNLIDYDWGDWADSSFALQIRADVTEYMGECELYQGNASAARTLFSKAKTLYEKLGVVVYPDHPDVGFESVRLYIGECQYFQALSSEKDFDYKTARDFYDSAKTYTVPTIEPVSLLSFPKFYEANRKYKKLIADRTMLTIDKVNSDTQIHPGEVPLNILYKLYLDNPVSKIRQGYIQFKVFTASDRQLIYTHPPIAANQMQEFQTFNEWSGVLEDGSLLPAGEYFAQLSYLGSDPKRFKNQSPISVDEISIANPDNILISDIKTAKHFALCSTNQNYWSMHYTIKEFSPDDGSLHFVILSKKGNKVYEVYITDFSTGENSLRWDGKPLAGPMPPEKKRTYVAPGAYEAKLTFVPNNDLHSTLSDSFWVDIVSIDLKAMSFSGEASKFHLVKNDITGVEFESPQWQAHFASEGERKFPICYTKSSTVKVLPVFRINASASFSPKTVLIKGRYVDFSNDINLRFPQTVFDVKESELAVKVPLKSIDVLTKKISHIKSLKIKWSASIDGGKHWYAAGESDNPFYVILSAPVNQNLLYYTVVHISCKNGSRINKPTSNVNLVIDEIWKEFTDVSSGVKRQTDLKRLTYYKHYTTKVTDLVWLLRTGDGECRAWNNLFVGTINLQFPEIVCWDAQISVPDNDAEGMFIANWHFDAQGLVTQPPAPGFNFLNIGKKTGIHPPSYDGYAWRKSQVSDLMGAAGQSNPNPASIFIKHLVAEVNGKFYDPSYGRKWTHGQDFYTEMLSGLFIEKHAVELNEASIGVDLDEDGAITNKTVATNFVFYIKKMIDRYGDSK
jgi:hypothetical protein